MPQKPESIECVHCHKQTPTSRPYKAPDTIYVVMWRTKTGKAHPSKPPIVLQCDEKTAFKEFDKQKQRRTRHGPIPVLIEYAQPEDGHFQDDYVDAFP